METNSDKISQRRAARDKLFAVLERRLSRINAYTETKSIVRRGSASSDKNVDRGLAVLGAADATSAKRKLADMALPRRSRSRQNARSSRMGA